MPRLRPKVQKLITVSVATTNPSDNTAHREIVSALLEWFIPNARNLPWRRTIDPYAIWVSEIMLQQTQVKTVIPYWERWMRELPDIASLAAAHSDKIHKLWEGLGYYTRVRNMQRAAQQILGEHKGVFPQTHEAVLSLTGIGRYTAGAICSIAFNQPTPILDGNVIRVLTRLFAISENAKEKTTNDRLWRIAEALVQTAKATQGSDAKQIRHCSYLNQSLMELGALICTPRQPQCPLCAIQQHCLAFRENRVTEYPNLGERPTATRRRFIAFIVQRDGRFLVRQRPEGVVNAHLWEFPNFEVTDRKLTRAVPKSFSKISKQPFCTIKHSITRYRISLEAYRAELQSPDAAEGRWFTAAELQNLPFPSAHKKILDRCLLPPSPNA